MWVSFSEIQENFGYFRNIVFIYLVWVEIFLKLILVIADHYINTDSVFFNTRKCTIHNPFKLSKTLMKITTIILKCL